MTYRQINEHSLAQLKQRDKAEAQDRALAILENMEATGLAIGSCFGGGSEIRIAIRNIEERAK